MRRYAIITDKRICELLWSKIRKNMCMLILTVGGISPFDAEDILEMNFAQNWIREFFVELRKLRRSVFNYFLQFWFVSSYNKTNVDCATLIILAPRDEILPDVKRRAIFLSQGTNIINVARKHSQHLFCYMKKQTKI